jgi:DNA-binding NarL/FixJ family response regulator
MVRVLVAEDRPMFRDALQATLTLTGRFEVVARSAAARTPWPRPCAAPLMWW